MRSQTSWKTVVTDHARSARSLAASLPPPFPAPPNPQAGQEASLQPRARPPSAARQPPLPRLGRYPNPGRTRRHAPAGRRGPHDARRSAPVISGLLAGDEPRGLRVRFPHQCLGRREGADAERPRGTRTNHPEKVQGLSPSDCAPRLAGSPMPPCRQRHKTARGISIGHDTRWAPRRPSLLFILLPHLSGNPGQSAPDALASARALGGARGHSESQPGLRGGGRRRWAMRLGRPETEVVRIFSMTPGCSMKVDVTVRKDGSARAEWGRRRKL